MTEGLQSTPNTGEVRRDALGRLLPGASLNPRGRIHTSPEAREVREILLLASPSAARRMVQLMESADEKIAFAACKEVLEKVVGKSVASDEEAINSVTSILGGQTTADLIRLAMTAAKVAIDGREPH